MKEFIVYALIDPESGLPVYVGATCRGLNRPLEWFKRPSRAWPTFKEWLELNKAHPKITILEECTFETLFSREMYWIERLRSEGVMLFNRVRVQAPKVRQTKSRRVYKIDIKYVARMKRLNKAKRERRQALK